MRPSTGRTVHYVSFGSPGGEYKSECRAAVITEVVPVARGSAVGRESMAYGISLCVLNPEGLFFNRNVQQDEENHRGGTWHWPERVPDDPPVELR